MLNMFKTLFTRDEILNQNYGVEREGLRVTKEGTLAKTNHPKDFGNKIKNPYITTDFSESQLELITPVLSSSKEVHDFLTSLYNIVALEIGNEYIWPESMPCIINNEDEIPLAKFCKCKKGEEARLYREELLRKYGGKVQLISGIHYNFSFKESFLKELYNSCNKGETFRDFKDNIYLKITRNYLKYNWFLIYLLGGTGVIHESFKEECNKKLCSISKNAHSCKGIVSYRNTECGYGNKITLYGNYSSTKAYVEEIRKFIQDGVIQSPKEFYNSIRLKGKDPYNLLESLENEGIQYLEYRSIDINPFSKVGISKKDLEFLEVFNLYLLFKDENNFCNWQEEALTNRKNIARNGGLKINLLRNGVEIDKSVWGIEILHEILEINNYLNLNKESIIMELIEKFKDYSNTTTSKFVEKVKEEGYLEAHLSLAKTYRQSAYNKRYSLVGYEDMELSTQILIKEALKRGIKVDVLDKSDNFILLSKDGKEELVKQATKTSLDNYVTVLAMNNKLVTKKILHKACIKVPYGDEYTSMELGLLNIKKYINKPIVIKPKSTNFGIGISIFPEGASLEKLEKALSFAFTKDNTVLVEEYIKGKEFRILCIGNKVSGILHRVPANVKGDGIHSISELITIKNENPLRGKGYKSPLEIIQIDEVMELYLEQQGLNINSVLNENEVVYLRSNSNISTGGDSIDYTEKIPEKFKAIALEAMNAIGAKICGVDMILEDYENENSNYGIIELNFNPAIHIHSYPFIGEERNIAKDILLELGFKEGPCD